MDYFKAKGLHEEESDNNRLMGNGQYATLIGLVDPDDLVYWYIGCINIFYH